MKKITFFAALAVLFTVTGCNQRFMDFTVISSKNVTLRLPEDGKGPRSTGRDMKFCGRPELKAAVDKAIETAGPGYDALIDGVIYARNEFFRMGYQVEGTPIKTSKLKASE